MDALRDADIRGMFELVSNCAQAPDLSAFAASLTAGVRARVPGSAAAYNEIDLTGGGEPTVILDPPDAWVPALAEAFTAFAHQNPLVARYARTGSTEVLRLSDVATERELRRTDLYNHVYRHVEADHQVAFALRPSRDVLVGLAVNRADRDFTDREVAFLTGLRPVLEALWERAALLTMLASADGDAPALLLVSAGDSIAHTTPGARRLLTSWFPAAPDGRVPEELRPWLRVSRRARDGFAMTPPFLVRRGDARLVVACHPGHGAGDVLSLRVAGPGIAATAAALGLTPRETEVAELIAAGASNADAATQLGIAPATVAKHLEHIYDKLGVYSRTEAVAVLTAAD